MEELQLKPLQGNPRLPATWQKQHQLFENFQAKGLNLLLRQQS